MAYLDDRIWCHPKFVGLSPIAFSSYVKAVAYSSGMGTGGHLDVPQQRIIGATARARAELVAGGLWDLNGEEGSVLIHDWADYNGKRDERKARDRERKRRQRMSRGNGADNPSDI